MEEEKRPISPEELKWVLRGRDPHDLPWPLDENGVAEEAVWLVNVRGSGIEFEMSAAMLRSFGIPILRAYPQSGRLLRVVAGYTGGGMDIYVPKSLLDDARVLYEGGGEIVEENEQFED